MINIRDQDYFLLRDGRILTAHGWTHPEGFVIGELSFVPDENGDRTFFGRHYRKPYHADGQGMPEQLRDRVRHKVGGFYDSSPLFWSKSIVSLDTTAARVGSEWPRVEDGLTSNRIRTVLLQARRVAQDLLGECANELEIGLTGSLNLGINQSLASDPHDIDLVFTGRLAAVSRAARAMRMVGRRQEGARVREYGKGWQIRLNTTAGLLCSFFGYADPADAPLRHLRNTRIVARNMTVTGTIIDDVHNVYLPTVLRVEPEISIPSLSRECRNGLTVVISHLRSRGDFYVGDRGEFEGELVEVETADASFLALSVLDGNSSRLLSPPWDPY